MKKIINSLNAPAPIGPYSQATIYGDMLYISGQIPLNQATGKLMMDSIEEQTEQVMKNLKYVLEEAGTNFRNVLKCSIFITNMEDFSKINEVYGKYFDKNPPARETVAVKTLPKNVNVEISCIAFI